MTRCQGNSPAVTAQETGDEAIAGKTWHHESLTPLLNWRQLLATPLLTFVFEKAMDKAKDAVEAVVATRGGPLGGDAWKQELGPRAS